VAGKPFDVTLKVLLEAGPEDWTVLAGLPHAPTQIIDADIATVSGAADKVLRVEADPPCLLHLEFLAGHDAADLPRLLHKRNLLLEDRHDLAVRTLVVVLRPEANSPALTGMRRRTFPGEMEPYTTFRYDVLRVWQMPARRFLAGGPALLPLAPISAVTQEQLPGIIRQIEKRLYRRPRAEVGKLWTATYVLMGLRYSADLAEQLLAGVVSMKESVTYQKILREGLAEGRAKGLAEGRAEGLAKGLAEGRAEGRAEGAVVEARKLLLLQGESRFGRPADAKVRAALESIQDVAQLEALSLRLLTAANWQELLGSSLPRRRNGRPRRAP
jgi:predicted transposase YdaD